MAGKKAKHKIRARMKNGMAEVKLLLQHPMETGNRKDPATGLKIPRDFIRELTCERNDVPVLTAQWSWGIAKNPFLSFRIREAGPGDRLTIHWEDDRGRADELKTVVT